MSLQEVLEYFKSVCSNTHITKGDFDDDPSFADNEVNYAHGIAISRMHGFARQPSKGVGCAETVLWNCRCWSSAISELGFAMDIRCARGFSLAVMPSFAWRVVESCMANFPSSCSSVSVLLCYTKEYSKVASGHDCNSVSTRDTKGWQRLCASEVGSFSWAINSYVPCTCTGKWVLHFN